MTDKWGLRSPHLSVMENIFWFQSPLFFLCRDLSSGLASYVLAFQTTLISLFFVVQAKTTKKIVLRLECTVCKYRKQLPLKRCKHFELGGDKKRKVTSKYLVKKYISLASISHFKAFKWSNQFEKCVLNSAILLLSNLAFD